MKFAQPSYDKLCASVLSVFSSLLKVHSQYLKFGRVMVQKVDALSTETTLAVYFSRAKRMTGEVCLRHV